MVLSAVIGISILLLLIIKLKIHPVLSLLVSSLVIGLGAGIIMTMPELATLSPVHLACVVLAINGGSSAFSHFNDSGFWMVSSLLKISEKDTLKSWTMMETIVGLTGLGCAIVIAIFSG